MHEHIQTHRDRNPKTLASNISNLWLLSPLQLLNYYFLNCNEMSVTIHVKKETFHNTMFFKTNVSDINPIMQAHYVFKVALGR